MDKNLKFLRRKIRRRIDLRKRSINRPRLSVFRSNKHIYAQIIDMNSSDVVASASSLEKDIMSKFNGKLNFSNKAAAVLVGRLLADRAVQKKIKDVVFDVSGYKYHGVVAALADEARKSLNF